MTRNFDFASNPCELATMRQAVREFLEQSKLPELEAELIVLALDEACTNIIRHAYQGCPDGRIEMTAALEPGALTFKLRDFGTPCDPSRMRSRQLDDFRPGGLGLHIMQSAFDQVTFCPQSNGTELRLKKFFPNPAPPPPVNTPIL